MRCVSCAVTGYTLNAWSCVGLRQLFAIHRWWWLCNAGRDKLPPPTLHDIPFTRMCATRPPAPCAPCRSTTLPNGTCCPPTCCFLTPSCTPKSTNSQVRYPPTSTVYPVPQHYTAEPRMPGERPSEDDLKTTNRMSYKPRCVWLQTARVCAHFCSLNLATCTRHKRHANNPQKTTRMHMHTTHGAGTLRRRSRRSRRRRSRSRRAARRATRASSRCRRRACRRCRSGARRMG